MIGRGSLKLHSRWPWCDNAWPQIWGVCSWQVEQAYSEKRGAKKVTRHVIDLCQCFHHSIQADRNPLLNLHSPSNQTKIQSSGLLLICPFLPQRSAVFNCQADWAMHKFDCKRWLAIEPGPFTSFSMLPQPPIIEQLSMIPLLPQAADELETRMKRYCGIRFGVACPNRKTKKEMACKAGKCFPAVLFAITDVLRSKFVHEHIVPWGDGWCWDIHVASSI